MKRYPSSILCYGQLPKQMTFFLFSCYVIFLLQASSVSAKILHGNFYILGVKSVSDEFLRLKTCEFISENGILFTQKPFELLSGNIHPFSKEKLCPNDVSDSSCQTHVCIIDSGASLKPETLERLELLEVSLHSIPGAKWFLAQIKLADSSVVSKGQMRRVKRRQSSWPDDNSTREQQLQNDVPIGYMNEASGYLEGDFENIRELKPVDSRISYQPIQEYMRNESVRLGDQKHVSLAIDGDYVDLSLSYIDRQLGDMDRTIIIEPSLDLGVDKRNSFNWVEFHPTTSTIIFTPTKEKPGLGLFNFALCGIRKHSPLSQSCGNFTLTVMEPLPLKQRTSMQVEAGLMVDITNPISTKFPGINIDSIKKISHKTSGNILVTFFNLSRLIFVTELDSFTADSSVITFVLETISLDIFRLELQVETKGLDRSNKMLVNYRTKISMRESDDTCNLELLHRFYEALVDLISLAAPMKIDIDNVRLIYLYSRCNTTTRKSDVPDIPIYLRGKTVMIFDWLILVPMKKASQADSDRMCEQLELNEMKNIQAFIESETSNRQEFGLIRRKFDPQILKQTDKHEIYGGKCPQRRQYEVPLYIVQNNTNVNKGIPFKIRIERKRLSEKLTLCNEDFTHESIPRWLAFNASEDLILGLVTDSDQVEMNRRYSFNLCTVLSDRGALRLSVPNQNPTFHLYVRREEEFLRKLEFNSHKIISQLKSTDFPGSPWMMKATEDEVGERYKIIMAVDEFSDYLSSYLMPNCVLPECSPKYSDAYNGRDVYISSWKYGRDHDLNITWHWIPLSRVSYPIARNEAGGELNKQQRCNTASAITYLEKVITDLKHFIRSGSDTMKISNFRLTNHQLEVSVALTHLKSPQRECTNQYNPVYFRPNVLASNFTVYAGYAFNQEVYPQVVMANLDDLKEITILQSDGQEVNWIQYSRNYPNNSKYAHFIRGHDLVGLALPALVRLQPYHFKISLLLRNLTYVNRYFYVTVSMPTWYPKDLAHGGGNFMSTPRPSYFPDSFIRELNHLIKLELIRDSYVTKFDFDTISVWHLMRLLNRYLNKSLCMNENVCKMDLVLLQVTQRNDNTYVVTAASEALLRLNLGKFRRRRSASSTFKSSGTCPIDEFERLQALLASRDLVSLIKHELNLKLNSSEISLQNLCKPDGDGLSKTIYNKGDKNDGPVISTKTYPKYLFLLTVIVPICAFVILTLLFTLILIYCVQKKKKKHRLIRQEQGCVAVSDSSGNILSNTRSSNANSLTRPEDFQSFDYNTAMKCFPNSGTLSNRYQPGGGGNYNDTFIDPTSPKLPSVHYQMSNGGYPNNLDTISLNANKVGYHQTGSMMNGQIIPGTATSSDHYSPTDPLCSMNTFGGDGGQMNGFHAGSMYGPPVHTNLYYPNGNSDSARTTPLLSQRKQLVMDHGQMSQHEVNNMFSYSSLARNNNNHTTPSMYNTMTTSSYHPSHQQSSTLANGDQQLHHQLHHHHQHQLHHHHHLHHLQQQQQQHSMSATSTPIDSRYHLHGNGGGINGTMIKRNGLSTLNECSSTTHLANGINNGQKYLQDGIDDPEDAFILPSSQLWNGSNRNSIFLGDSKSSKNNNTSNNNLQHHPSQQ